MHLHVARGVGAAGRSDRRRRHDVLHDRKELVLDRRRHVRGEVARRAAELAPVAARRAARLRVSRRAALQRYVRRSRARARRRRRPYALGSSRWTWRDAGRLDADGADRRQRHGLHRQRGRRPDRRHWARLRARRARRPRRLAVRRGARRARGAGDLAERGPLSDHRRCVLDVVRARHGARRALRAGRQPRARLRRRSARRRQLVHELADRARRGDRANRRLQPARQARRARLGRERPAGAWRHARGPADRRVREQGRAPVRARPQRARFELRRRPARSSERACRRSFNRPRRRARTPTCRCRARRACASAPAFRAATSGTAPRSIRR